MRSWAVPLLAACIFILLAGDIASYPGVHNDEAIFASPLYSAPLFTWEIARHTIPIMVMNYAGALKTWIYALIFAFWTPSALSLRIPMILAGALVVALFHRCLVLIHGYRAAALGALLLATDPVFVLTDCFDWGPVALQHLFLVLGLLFALRYSRLQRTTSIFWLFLVFGLGLWDKALFIWLLTGLGAGALLVYPRQLKAALTPRNAAAAVIAFSLGALPLIYFNVTHGMETFRSNTHLDTADLGAKFRILAATADGSTLFGYLVRNETGPDSLRPPHSKLERASAGIRQFAGPHRRDLTASVFLACVALLPILWRTRAFKPCLFSLLVMGVAWAQMATTKNAGGAAHHTILLWPLPLLLISVVAAQLSERGQHSGTIAFYVLMAAMVGSNLLVQNQYFSQMAAYGSPAIWSDAMYTLSKKLPLYDAEHVNVIDWGMLDTQVVLHRGNLPLRPVAPYFLPGAMGKEQSAALFAEPHSLWLTHADSEQAYAGINQRFEQAATDAGYATAVTDTIYDRNGHAIFELLRLEHMQPK